MKLKLLRIFAAALLIGATSQSLPAQTCSSCPTEGQEILLEGEFTDTGGFELEFQLLITVASVSSVTYSLWIPDAEDGCEREGMGSITSGPCGMITIGDTFISFMGECHEVAGKPTLDNISLSIVDACRFDGGAPVSVPGSGPAGITTVGRFQAAGTFNPSGGPSPTPGPATAQIADRSGAAGRARLEPSAKIVGVDLTINPTVFEYRPGRDTLSQRNVNVYAKVLYSSGNIPENLEYDPANWVFGIPDPQNTGKWLEIQGSEDWEDFQMATHLIPDTTDPNNPMRPIVAGSDDSPWTVVGSRIKMNVLPVGRDAVPTAVNVPIRAEYRSPDGQRHSKTVNFQFRPKTTGTTSDNPEGPTERTLTYRRIRG